MNKTLLVVIVVVAALALGIGGAYAVNQALPTPAVLANEDQSIVPFTQETPEPGDTGEDEDEGDEIQPFTPPGLDRDRLPDLFERFSGKKSTNGWREKGFTPPGQLDKNRKWPDLWRIWGPEGMMPREDDFEVTGERITLDQALTLAQDYADEYGENLRVARIYEFKSLFYAVVEETDTEMGAFQLIIQPVSGNVRMDTGPCAVWNTMYGKRAARNGESAANTLTMEAAAEKAKQALADRSIDGIIDPQGIAFYGYYTFEYSVEGEIAGLISVNAEDGDYWFHNWLGDFISREDI